MDKDTERFLAGLDSGTTDAVLRACAQVFAMFLDDLSRHPQQMLRRAIADGIGGLAVMVFSPEGVRLSLHVTLCQAAEDEMRDAQRAEHFVVRRNRSRNDTVQ